MYVAQIAETGVNDKTWYFNTDGKSTGSNKIIVRGLHHGLDRAHVLVAGYYSDNISLPDYTYRSASDRLYYGKEPVAFVAKIDVSKTYGLGPGTSGWFAELDTLLGAELPGGAQVYSVDGFVNGDVLVSYAGCTAFNNTPGAVSPFSGFNQAGGLGCKHYISRLWSLDGSPVWTKEMPASFEQTGTVHNVPIFEEFEPCRVIEDGHFFCAFHLAINESVTFDGLPQVGPGKEPTIGIVKFDSSGDAVWANATLVASSASAMSVNKDGTLLVVSGSDPAGSSYRTGKPGQIARIDTSVGKEGEVLWVDKSGVGSHGIRDCVVTWDPTDPIQQVLGLGQIQSEETLTDKNGAKTTLNVRGSYEVFLVSYNPDGSGRYAVDGGSEGLEYFFDLGHDMDTGDIVMAGGVGYNSKVLQWGNVKRPNVMYCDGAGTQPIESMKAFGVKLNSRYELPDCLNSCNSTTGTVEVKTGHCYIGRYCYKDDEIAPYTGSECLKCDAGADPIGFTGPDVTKHCYIAGRSPGSGTCVAEGTMKMLSRSETSDCLKCQPDVDPYSYSVAGDYRLEDDKCVAITWEDKAHAAGWVPCKITSARMRRLAMKPSLPKAKADDEDDEL